MASLGWMPDQEGLTQLSLLLQDSFSPDTATQIRVRKQLELFQQVQEYPNYLAYVLVHSDQAVSHRAMAGLILKGNLNMRPNVSGYVHACLLVGLKDPQPLVRQTVGTLMAGLLKISGIDKWPEALHELMRLLQAEGELAIQESTFKTLSKICDDLSVQLSGDYNGSRPTDFMIPTFGHFLSHPSPKMRECALTCLNKFVELGPELFGTNLDSFITAVFARAADTDPAIRRLVCKSIISFLVHMPDKLIPNIRDVSFFMQQSMLGDEPSVALEACEFWLEFADKPSLQQHLLPILPDIAPILLKCMVYSEEDLLMLDGAEEDSHVPDKESDIKPKIYQGKSSRRPAEISDPSSSTSGAKATSASHAEADNNLDDEDDEDDDEEGDNDDDDDDDVMDWSLRKCSAAALDMMAVTFGDTLLTVLLPLLKERLFDQEWLVRESAILALGAIAEGCMHGIEEHLPTLVPHLISILRDPKPLVRSITCWTLGRYSAWISQPVEERKELFFVPLMEGLLRMVLDPNKRVQEAGCSAFATLEEEAGEALIPFLEPILKNLVHAFSTYQHKNLLILYDALGTLADSVGDALDRKDFMDILTPPLFVKWHSLADDDEDIVALLECLSSIAVSAKISFAPYAPVVFTRSLSIITANIQAFEIFMKNPEVESPPDKTFLIVALDTISGLAQGLGSAISELILANQPSLLQLMAACLRHPEADVQRSAFALLGDMSINCFELLQPLLPQIMPMVSNIITPDPQRVYEPVVNNAIWAAGEISLKYGQEIRSFAPTLVERLIAILLNNKVSKSLSENAGVTIGRLGLVCADLVAPSLDKFSDPWCIALWDVQDNEEKDSAFRGFCKLISANPNGLTKSFILFCNAVVKWQTPSIALNDMFRTIIQGFKQMSGAQWPQWQSQMDPSTLQKLSQRYEV